MIAIEGGVSGSDKEEEVDVSGDEREESGGDMAGYLYSESQTLGINNEAE